MESESIQNRIIKLARINEYDLFERKSKEEQNRLGVHRKGSSVDGTELESFERKFYNIKNYGEKFNYEIYNLAVEILILLRKKDRKFVVKLLMDQDVSCSDEFRDIRESDMGEYYYNKVKRIKNEYPDAFKWLAECINENCGLGYSNILKIIGRIDVETILRGW